MIGFIIVIGGSIGILVRAWYALSKIDKRYKDFQEHLEGQALGRYTKKDLN